MAQESSQEPTIQRCPHDKENPYVMVSNDLIRNQGLSPNCRWLLIYLLSNDDKKWNIRVSQIAKHVAPHFAKRKLYKIINEAIEAGYIKRVQEKECSRYSQVTYYLSEKPKFKEMLPHVKNEHAQKGHNKKEKPEKKEKTGPVKKEKAPPPREKWDPPTPHVGKEEPVKEEQDRYIKKDQTGGKDQSSFCSSNTSPPSGSEDAKIRKVLEDFDVDKTDIRKILKAPRAEAIKAIKYTILQEKKRVDKGLDPFSKVGKHILDSIKGKWYENKKKPVDMK